LTNPLTLTTEFVLPLGNFPVINHAGILALTLWLTSLATASEPPSRWWGADVEQALLLAKNNRPELEKALLQVPKDQRKGMAFLITHMPQHDRLSLSSDFLITNCELAYKARKEVPWGKKIPEDIFLNDVLPYANVDEKRDPWRREFYDLCMPIVKDCKTPSEAAQKLNAEVFGKLKVSYSTQRRAANQSPKETIEQGKASCTGLSIILSDACRSVCIPARLVGTPLWADRSGNHTWVEIWDKDWHFTGACEPDPNGLNRGWFTAKAAQARREVPEHAIYAVSFKKTDQHFPLVWARRNTDVPGLNVTDRYANTTKTKPDTSRSGKAIKWLRDTVEKNPSSLAELTQGDHAQMPLTKADAHTARELIWKIHTAIIQKERAAELKARKLTEGQLEMPFDYTIFGKKPTNGWSLWISLHGGGNAPAQVNDQQWENQKKLYTLDEGIYLAPRAPTNTWNLWHEPHIDRLFTRLIEDLIVLEGVDPNRVYLLGYSAGGDGVYQLAPRMADRWAGAGMMAGHPNGVSLLSLRNVPFALQVGSNDSAYYRNKVGREYGQQLEKLQKDDPKGYNHFVKIHEGKGHWMDREDRVALPWLAKFTRNPAPDRVVWKQTGTPHERLYWLAVPPGEAKVDTLIIAKRESQTVEITAAEKVQKLVIRFNDQMINFDQPVKITCAGQELFSGELPRTIGTMVKTLQGRGDLTLMFDAEVEVLIPTQK
jgi:predicted peptidase